MTNEEKRLLAAALIDSAANLLEVIGNKDGYHNDLVGINRDEAAAQLAKWLKSLPGDYWNNALPQPQELK